MSREIDLSGEPCSKPSCKRLERAQRVVQIKPLRLPLFSKALGQIMESHLMTGQLAIVARVCY